MTNARKCRVLVPVASTIEPETHDGLSRLIERGYDVRLLRGCSQVDLARSILASDALRDGFDETLWIDSDVVFDPDDVERLREHQEPIVAGLYVKKGRDEFACKFLPGTNGLLLGPAGGLLEIEYAGMGFTLIRREVYETIVRKLELPACTGGYDPDAKVTPYFTPAVVPDAAREHCYLSEDYALCYRARLCGYRILADTRIRLGHVARHVRTWDDLTKSRPQEEEPMSAKLYEQLGRKQERIEELDAAYTQLLNLLAGVVSGEIDRSRVLVNLTERSWTVAPAGQTPSLPATVNGLPQCVVAPAEFVPMAELVEEDA